VSIPGLKEEASAMKTGFFCDKSADLTNLVGGFNPSEKYESQLG
jgi:hypothetical protein